MQINLTFKRLIKLSIIVFHLSIITAFYPGIKTEAVHAAGRLHNIRKGMVKKWQLIPIGIVNTYFRHYQKPGLDIFMINLHQNEKTSIRAAVEIVNRYGGTFVRIYHRKSRKIVFQDKKFKKFIFDPNRIFSDSGAKATLKKHKNYSSYAHSAVRDFAKELAKKFIDSNDVIIAMHNNPNRGPFNVFAFASKYYEPYIERVYINRRTSKNDFYFVTEKFFFEYFKKHRLSVVLQRSENPISDGSLSEYCARKKIPYINIECQHGHKKIQVRMAKLAADAVVLYKSLHPKN